MPISYLILIGEVELLATLFNGVYIPAAVAAELSEARAPEAVRRWSATPPPWLWIVDVDPVSATLIRVLLERHRGENEEVD